MITECPNPQPDCKYFERGCFSDTDHIVPRRLATTVLSSIYIIDLPSNREQLCRKIHEEKTARGDEPLPSVEEMREALVIAQSLGEIVLSKRKMKAAYGKDWKDYYNQAMLRKKEIQHGNLEVVS